VWTLSKPLGERQMQTSKRLWQVEKFDLMQIHNLLDWQVHLETAGLPRPMAAAMKNSPR